MFTAMFAVKKPYEKILRRLYTGLALLNLFIFLTALQSLYESREDHKDVAQASVENLSRALEWHIADTFANIDLTLRFVAKEYAYLSANAAAWEKTLAAHRGHLKILNSLLVADSAGNIVHGLGTPGPAGVNVSDSDYFISLRDDPKAGLVISQPLAGQVTGTWIIILARRLSNADGSFAGTIMAGLPLDHLQKLFTFYTFGKFGSIALRDDGLRLIVRSPSLKGALQIGSTIMADEFAAALKINPDEGLYTSGDTSIDGIRRLHYYRRNAAYSFYINVGYARDDFLVEWKIFAIQNAFLVGLFLAASIFLARYLKHVWSQEHERFENLRESEELHRTILRTAMDGFLLVRPDGRLEQVNEAYCLMSGYSEQELLGMSVSDLEAVETPEETAAHMQTVMAQGHDRFETRHRRRDGGIFDVEISLQCQTMGGGRFVFFLHDITDRKKAEEALRVKKTELERFSYSVSHDLRSPLVTIQTFLGHLVQDMARGGTDQVAQDISFISSATEKMNNLLDELLKFTKVGHVTNLSVETPLQEIAHEAIGLVAGRIDKCGIRVTVTDNPVVLFGDRVRLVEVFQNLIDNAGKFMGDQSNPLIEIGAETKNGEMVFFVRDNGMGIDPKYKDKLFGMFEKFNPEMEGTGMGLALVKRIVEVHGGRIWAESEGLGKGVCFWFTLLRKSSES